MDSKAFMDLVKENDGFGDKAWEVSEKYGVTTFFSDINKEEESYHLRDILIGSEVDKPSEN